ncbi:MAG: hypothetical protein CSA42_02370 [Gammaproteobacteria bacterium]|nr:MAG: hypothetical protein CSA42_02370 [Gammaproteobacteria bacterium]
MQSFEDTLCQVLAENKGKRVVCFCYEGQKYWLKQVEQQKGAEKFLKPFPTKAIQLEIKRLKWLNQRHVPTAQLVYSGDDYFVTTDVGDCVSQLLQNSDKSEDEKQQVIAQSAQKLAELHNKNLVHGRPAIRDITYLNNQVYFIDFEAKSLFSSLYYQKRRDVIVFFYSMFQAKIDEKYIHIAMQNYAKTNPENWQASLNLLKRLSFIYYICLPFKSVARSDLISIYGLFEVLLDK